MKEGTCVLKDNLNEVREKMIKFDGLVIGSPTYNREITGQLKTFYDRLWYDIHNQTFAGKYAICIILLLGYALRFIKSHHQAYISHRQLKDDDRRWHFAYPLGVK